MENNLINKKAKLFFLGIPLLMFFIFYFFVDKRIKDKNLFAVCSIDRKTNIDLVNTVGYISKYNIRRDQEEVHIDIYTTTQLDFFNTSRQINIVLDNINTKYIYINDIKYEAKICKKTSFN